MGPGPRPMGPLARAKKKVAHNPGRSVPPRQTGATFFLPGPKGPWALGPGPWPLVVYYYIITPLFYIIILFYILFYIFYTLLWPNHGHVSSNVTFFMAKQLFTKIMLFYKNEI